MLAAPANDNLADAIAITTPATSGIVASGTNAGATFEGGEIRPCDGSFGATVWYTWTSPGTPGTAVFDTFGSNIDTVLAIYTGSGYPLTSVGCNDDLSGAGPSALTLTYAAGTTYRIQVGGYNGATGSVVLSMSTGAAMYVNNNADTNTSDGALTLREAMLLARGGTGAGGLNRALGADAGLVLNAGAAGATGSDLIHFTTAFPASTGATITLGSGLPVLDAGSDVISGIGAGVIIDGQDLIATCVRIDSNGNVVEGLDIRRCDIGIAIGTGSGNRIGGSLIPSQANFISGSDETGILIGLFIAATGNSVVGNVVGVRRDGTFDIFDLNSVGIRMYFGGASNTIGGSGPGEGNVVSLSTADGIQTFDDNNVIMGNKIGTDPTGSFGYGNIGYGISIGGTGNIVGGIGPGEGNTIASNGQWGVNVSGVGTIGTTIRGNSIHSNTQGGIVGSETNTGVPVISSVSANAVSGTACGLCTVDIYSDTGGQGRVYVGTTTADSLGVFAATGIAHPLGNVTATATINGGTYVGSTSHFSAPFAAATNLDGDGLFDVVDACVSAPEDEDGFQDADGCPDPDNDSDGITDSSDVGKYTWTNSTPGATDCRNVPEDLDAFHDDDGCPEPDNDNDGHPDALDYCPATDYTAGPDGVADTDDEPLNSLSVPIQTKEDWDGILDFDGCHDSPGDDYDGDGFSDELEALAIGTNPAKPCALTATANDEDPDPFPSDADDNQRVNIGDVIILFSGKILNPPAYSARSDFDDNGSINIGDVIIGFSVKAHIFDECAPGPPPGP